MDPKNIKQDLLLQTVSKGKWLTGSEVNLPLTFICSWYPLSSSLRDNLSVSFTAASRA